MDQRKGNIMSFMLDSTIQVFNIESLRIFEKEKRFNASFYSREVIASKILIENLEKKGIQIKSIDDFSNKIFWPGRFKRTYVSKGAPFLMPSEIIMLLPKAKKFVINYPKEVLIKKNWLLITRSGSIGRCLIATRLLEESVLTDDLIRIVPKYENTIGFLYAYLNTWMGQAFLTKDQYGATVKHIEPHHVAAIPIPIISKLEKEVNKNILLAHNLREEAQFLLLKAEEMIYKELKLPRINEEDILYFGGEKGRIIKSFEMKSNELNSRLDASHYLPVSYMVTQKLREAGSGSIKKLKDVADSFVPPRFKRAYVKDLSEGIPLLQGTHIPQNKPYDLKYIWNKMENLDSYIVRKNWILVTCSGTIGRLSLVRDYWDKWAATNHLLRIIPKESEIDPGFLTAFLLNIYGQVQFQRLTYGGVVDEIGEAGKLFNNILILKPKQKSIEQKIGDLVYEAYDKRDRAIKIEEEYIKILEKTLVEIANK